MFIKMMTIIKKINNLSTTLESIFLLMLRPLMPPRMPPMTMRAKSHIVNSGTVLVTRELIRLVIWEKRMMYREFWAAVFVSMEKK